MATTRYVFPNIVAEMARKGDTLQTLSAKLGMSYQTLSARLTGKRSFELPEIYKLMQLYDEDFETLFTQRSHAS
jgi:transcriptional regulator with XRE-family HTH domain